MYKSSGGQKERPGESCQPAMGDTGRFGEGEKLAAAPAQELARSDSAKERSGHTVPGAKWDHPLLGSVATWWAGTGLGK